ncbi:unnamed protein product [Rhizophagus irregularis]|nr:unnamed protein product [Rhizophagus irregularis]
MTIQAGLKLISIALDGVSNEFNAQVELMKGFEITEFLQYQDDFYNIKFSALIYRNRPIIRVQDLKYAEKNGRNNVHSGARLLILGYIFDIDDNILSQNEIELLRCWPNDDDIVDSSSDLNENDNGEHDNLELIEDQNQIDNAASEIVSNDDDESNSKESENENENNTIDNSHLNFIKATEIQYLLENNQPTFINPTEKEPEEEIFRNNNLPDVYQILSIRRFHDAYLRLDRIRGIRQQPGINLNVSSNDNVNRNTANHLITQLNSNVLNRQTVNNRTNRWLKRKRMENMISNQNILNS